MDQWVLIANGPATGTFGYVFDAKTGIVTITMVGDTFRVSGTNLANSTGWSNLGLTTPRGVAVVAIVLDNYINVTGPEKLYVYSSQLSSSYALDTTSGRLSKGSIIQDVPVNVAQGSIINYSSFANYFQCNNLAQPGVLDFSLRYPDGEIVDLNGLDWSMSIVLIG
jgi:hypothetical protein